MVDLFVDRNKTSSRIPPLREYEKYGRFTSDICLEDTMIIPDDIIKLKNGDTLFCINDLLSMIRRHTIENKDTPGMNTITKFHRTEFVTNIKGHDASIFVHYLHLESYSPIRPNSQVVIGISKNIHYNFNCDVGISKTLEACMAGYAKRYGISHRDIKSELFCSSMNRYSTCFPKIKPSNMFKTKKEFDTAFERVLRTFCGLEHQLLVETNNFQVDMKKEFPNHIRIVR